MKKLLPLFLISSFLFLNKESKGQWVNIPDTNFVNYLTATFPSAMSGNMMDTSSSVIVNATYVLCSHGGIHDLTGIQYFDNLNQLNCSYDSLTSLPNLPSGLYDINCAFNQLTSLPSLPNGISTIACDYNSLISLPALPTGLTFITCSGNQLTSLPIIPNGVSQLNCGYNQLTNLPPLPSGLFTLYFDHNLLDSLPPLPAGLWSLDCGYNPFIIQPTSFPSGLIYLSCSGVQLTSLPPLPNSLTGLECSYNLLTSLPVLPNSLTSLNCENNQLTSLPVLPNSLIALSCGLNPLTNLSPLPDSLTSFSCWGTPITCLPHLSTKLTYLDFGGSFISCIPNYVNIASCYPPLNSLPLCGIFSNGCPFIWNVTGKVHLDMDTSCTYNATDSSLHNIKVQLWQHGVLRQQVFSNIYGDYSFDVNVFDTFQITVDTVGLPFYLSCPAQQTLTSIISAADSTDINMNFAMLCKSLTDDVSAQNIIAGRHRPGQMVYTTINAGYANSIYGFGCTQANTSGQVKLVRNGASKFLASAYYSLTPSIITTDSLIWNVSDFNTFPSSISFSSQVDTTATIGQNICYTLSVIPTIPDANPANNVFQTCYPVMNGWDPNIKSVLPSGNLTAADSVLKYTIQFQNTGNDTAFNIIVRDTLDANLDVKSLKILGYSFEPYTQTFGNIMVFNFPHINLVDSTTNEPKSHGYISYSVKRKPNLPLGTTIKNTAFIYFDLNPAIVTNTTSSTLAAPSNVGVNDPSTTLRVTDELKIYPNPVGQSLFIGHLSLGNTNAIHIYDVLGREALYYSPLQRGLGGFEINVSKLTAGVYFIKLTDEKGNVRMGKFVKE